MTFGLSRWLLTAAAAALTTGCVPVHHNLPPAERLLEPGPGVGGPGPGIMEPPGVAIGGGAAGPMAAMGGDGGAPMGAPMQGAPMAGGDISQCAGGLCSPGAMPAVGGYGPMMAPMPAPTVQLQFSQPESMEIRYDASGSGQFDSEPLITPALQNFGQGGLYRLKLTNIVGREGVELYPTIEIACATPRTGAYLAHNAIPIQFTPDDLDQVLTGNFVTKVIYLPDPEFQGPAIAGIDTVVSTRLDPGLDPIVEADRRGTILAILRVGNKDIELGTEAAGGAYGSGVGPAFSGMPVAMGPCMTEGCAGGMYGPSGGAMPPAAIPGNIAGVTAPSYGMPMSGTPIGLPGPPHIPLGTPAGLQKHTMRNYTHMYIPKPVENVNINVRQQPGFSYPTPVSRINITEQNLRPAVPFGRPEYERVSQPVGAGANGEYCPPGQ